MAQRAGPDSRQVPSQEIQSDKIQRFKCTPILCHLLWLLWLQTPMRDTKADGHPWLVASRQCHKPQSEPLLALGWHKCPWSKNSFPSSLVPPVSPCVAQSYHNGHAQSNVGFFPLRPPLLAAAEKHNNTILHSVSRRLFSSRDLGETLSYSEWVLFIKT